MKTPVEKIQQQMKMNKELKNRKNVEKIERNASKVKTACKVRKSIERLKKIIIREKTFH